MPDYMVGNAPQGGTYRVPQVDTSWIGDLPELYRQGQLRRAFNEVPVDPKTGGPDTRAMANKIISIAGPQAAQPYIQLWGQQVAGQQLGQAMRGMPTGYEGGETPTSGYPDRNPHTSPGHLGAGVTPGQTYGTVGGRNPVAPEDNRAEGPTINSMIARAGIPPGPARDRMVQALADAFFFGDPDALDRTLQGDQPQTVQQAITNYQRALASQSQQAAQAQPLQTGGQPTAQPRPVVPQQQPGAIGAQPGPGPAPAGPLAPAQAPGSPGGPIAPQRGVTAGANDVLAVPPQFQIPTIGRVALAHRMVSAQLANPYTTPQQKAAAEATLKTFEDQLKAANDFWSKRGQVPDTIKEALTTTGTPDTAALAAAKKAQELQTTTSASHMSAMNESARAYEADLKPLFTMARSVLNQPDMYTGMGGNISLFKNRLLAAVGINPNAPQAQEMLGKITSMATLATINQQRTDVMQAGTGASGNAGRIFSQQVDLVAKTVPGLENSIAGNLALVEINDRMGALRSKIAEIANREMTARANSRDPALRANPYPPPQVLDEKISAYLKAHPIFTQDEIRNPTLLGARTFSSPSAAAAALGEGQVYKNANGDYVTAHKKPNG